MSVQKKEKSIEELLQTLPKAVENIIYDNVSSIEHKEKFSKCMEELYSRFTLCTECNNLVLAFDKCFYIEGSQEVDFICNECLNDWMNQDMAEEAYYDYELYATDSDL